MDDNAGMSRSTDPKPGSAAASDFTCDVARTLDDVLDCWRLAYRVYLRRGLIGPNHFGMHAPAEALGPDAAFVIARVRGVPVGTATAIVDGPAGLPLDSVFHEELEAFRTKGRRLMEIGLVAMERPDALFEILRFSIQCGRHADSTDVVCGMHPRRERLYQRLFALEPVGGVRSYAAMKNHPVRLMHVVYEVAHSPNGQARLARSLCRPVDDSIFTRRFRIEPRALSNVQLAEFARFVSASKAGHPPQAATRRTARPEVGE